MATTTRRKSGGSVLGALGSAFGLGGGTAAGGTTLGALGSALGRTAGSYGRALTGAAGTVGRAGLGALGTTAGAAYGGMPQISYGPPGGTAAQPAGARGAGMGPSSYFGQRMLPPAGPAPTGGGAAMGVTGGTGWRERFMRTGAERRRQMGMQEAYGRWGKEQAAARAANEARYQQMLGIAAKTTGQRETDIRADYAQREAAGMQRLARQGMAGTTIAPTMGMGYQREQSAALDRLADLMQQTKLGIIERRQDAYPDLGAYMAAGQMMA